MRYILSLLGFISSLLILTGCCCNGSFFGGPEYVTDGPIIQKIDSPELCHTIQHRMPYLRHEKRLRLENASIYYGDFVNTIRLEFISQDILEIRDARFLIVDLTEALLLELNTNPVIAPDYLNYPLTPDAFEIYITFESFEGLFIDPYYVGCIQLEEGVVHYHAFNTRYDGLNKWQLREELYDKAREFTIQERESEQLFHDAVDAEIPKRILKDQYFTPYKEVPRYYSPYDMDYIFERSDTHGTR